MNEFSGKDYLRIDIAGCYGLDKYTWDDRLLWVAENEKNLEQYVELANEPYLMAKAVLAYRDMQAGKPIGHNMHLDATCSGLGIMALLSGCKKTAAKVNLINTGKREDAYAYITEIMNFSLSKHNQVTRADIKPPLMQHYYCKATHEELNKVQEKVFLEALHGVFPGAEDFMDIVRPCWDSEALEHSWYLPDGHKVICKVKEMVNVRVEIDELDHVSMSYRFEANKSSKRDTSLCANIVHSIDGYIVREMVRMAKKQGFELAHIHDSFSFIPTYGNKVRKNYVEILAKIAESDLLADILTNITGEKTTIIKDSKDLGSMIRESNYALS